jgi:hypothetical protein
VREEVVSASRTRLAMRSLAARGLRSGVPTAAYPCSIASSPEPTVERNHVSARLPTSEPFARRPVPLQTRHAVWRRTGLASRKAGGARCDS